MFDISVDDVVEVYEQLKDRYDLVLTTTSALDEGFTVDFGQPVGLGCVTFIWGTEAGGAAAARLGEVVATHVIPRPHTDVNKLLPTLG